MVEAGHVTPCSSLIGQEWKKIGARRTRFLDLGLPSFGNPRKVYVKPHNNEESSPSHQTSLVGPESQQTKLVRQQGEGKPDHVRGGDM